MKAVSEAVEGALGLDDIKDVNKKQDEELQELKDGLQKLKKEDDAINGKQDTDIESLSSCKK